MLTEPEALMRDWQEGFSEPSEAWMPSLQGCIHGLFRKVLLPPSFPIAALCLALLSGCGSNSSKNEEDRKPAKLPKFKSEIHIKTLWSAGVGDGQGDGHHHLRPVIDGDVRYAAGSDGTVMALDRLRGKRLWKRDFDLPFSGGVGYGNGMLLLGTSDGLVLALDAGDGSQLWSTEILGEVMAPPQTDGEVVVVQDYTGKMRGLDAESGEPLWLHDSNQPVLTLRGTSTPVIFERLAIGGFGNGKVIALDISTGAVRWESRVAIAQGRSDIDRIVDLDGTMVLVGNILYAVSYQGRVAAIDIGTGRKQWQESASSYSGVEQGFGNIYVAEESGTVSAFYRNGEGVRWQQPDLAYRRLSAPKAIRGYLAVGDLEGFVHFMSQVDGRFVGRTKVDGKGIRADMLAVDNTLYVFGNSGRLEALRITAKD